MAATSQKAGRVWQQQEVLSCMAKLFADPSGFEAAALYLEGSFEFKNY